MSWPKEARQENGISQLLQFQQSGEEKFTRNQLAGNMTGFASVLTPLGTEISYVCAAE